MGRTWKQRANTMEEWSNRKPDDDDFMLSEF